MDNEIEINTKEGIYKVNGIDISRANKIEVVIDPEEPESIVRAEWN
ncbi:MAG: hypothetical protein GX275_02215 [Clostridiales bacterium]|nr:hypothetical protein [Clostridiales bacterium]